VKEKQFHYYDAFWVGKHANKETRCWHIGFFLV
jgi:hypothetical protein